MPTYTFKCDDCNLRFNRFLKISENHLLDCPSCKKKVQKLPAQNIGLRMAESTSIPKDIDLAVGKDAERRWMEYGEKDKDKEKIREESGSKRLSKTIDGEYIPLSKSLGGDVSEDDAVTIRKRAFKKYDDVLKDPKTKKIELEK